VADLAGATGVQIAAAPDGISVTITSVIDLPEARDRVALDETLVVIEWAPVRTSGPLPDLLPLLDPILVKNPTAVLVSPARPVNPPRQVVARAESARVCLLWNVGQVSHADLTTRIDRLLRQSTAVGPAVSSRSASVPDEILHVADDLDRLLKVTGRTLGADVRLAGVAGPSIPGVTMVQLSDGSVGGPVLEVRRDTALTPEERAFVEVLAPIFRMHAQLAETVVDDTAAEIARNLKNILGDDLVQRETSLRKSRRLSLFPRHPVVCLGIEPFGVSVDMNGLQQLKAAMTPVAARFDPDSITIVNAGTVVVMIRATIDFDGLARALYRSVQVPLAVGASDEVDDARSYPSSFRQAGRAVAVGRRVGAINRVTRYRDLGVLGLLYQLPEHARRSFVAETLGSVAGDTPESLDQRRVLRILRSTDCNIAESARELYVHPNTLRSRIARIEQITGPFMNEPERRLTIFTALAMFSLDNNVEGE
jgi:hypothetical protein